MLNSGFSTPVWCNFTFFSKIVPTAIEQKGRKERTDGGRSATILQRQVEFYVRKHRIAVVTLEGHHCNNDPDYLTGWEVIAVEYAMYCDSLPGKPVQDWRKVTPPHPSYTVLPR